jgi:16S rRNA processing protein RimM
VQGWIKIESWTEPRTKIFTYQPWLLPSAPGVEKEIAGVKGRPQGKGLVAQLPGVDDRDAAEALVGQEIYVSRELLPPPAKDEYYWVDLEGLEVVTTEGVALGRVSHLFATGANDVVVVKDGTRERLVPFIQGSYVRSVDLSDGRMVVDWDPEF